MRVLILIWVIFISGCVSSAMSGANMIYHHKSYQDTFCDYAIAFKIWHQIKQQICLDDNIHLNVTSFNRIVLLTGQVPSATIRSRIENLTKNIANVARVYNAIEISTPSSTSERLQDSWLTTKIKSKLIASNEVYADKIKVVSERNIVYLMGIITSEEAKLTTNLAKQTSGVKQVVVIFHYLIMPNLE